MNELSILTYGRRVLGSGISNRLRNIAVDSASLLKLVSSSDHLNRPDGISALVRVKDEEWWIEPSLLSIRNLVDEYIVIDASIDNTPKIADEIKEKKQGLNITHIIDLDEDLVRILNKALRLARFRWVLR